MTRNLFLTACLLGALLAPLPLPALAKAPACANPEALGTARVLQVGSAGGLAIGLKTYPQTLALADHELVLTFDDGPWPATTPAVLKALEDECVRATFFLIGRNAAAAPALVRQEIAAGHTVGHHSFSHPGVTLRRFSDEKARDDIDRGIAADDTAAYGAAGAEPRVPFFRFPGFADTTPLLRWLDARNMAVFGADIWASDWEEMTPQEELAKLLHRVEKAGRGIVMLHDIKERSAAILPAFLRELKKRGYSIVHIEPGPGAAETSPAGDNWVSDTERSLARMGFAERPDGAEAPQAAASRHKMPPLKGPL
jgi:peptidoglycan-N-acetylglucosamine deacetylase